MKKSRFALAAVIALAGSMALTACGSDDETPAAPPATAPAGGDENGGGDAPVGAGFAADALIGVALPQQTSENWVLAEDLFNDGLAAAGFTPQVQFAVGGVADQQAQIDAMIESGAAVIVIGALDGAQLGAQVERAREAGIYVIAYDRNLTQTENVDLYVAFNNFQVGVEQGTSLLAGLNELKGSAPWNIELIAGSADDANAPAFFNGAMSVLQPAIDAGDLIVTSGQVTFDQAQTTGWLAENAQARMETIIAGFYADGTALDGVLSPNDTLGRAALNAADDAGLPQPVVTGQDAEVASVQLVFEGRQFSTIYKDTRALVAETIRQIERARDGLGFDAPEVDNNGVIDVPTYFLPPISVTEANACEVFAGDPILEAVWSQFCS